MRRSPLAAPSSISHQTFSHRLAPHPRSPSQFVPQPPPANPRFFTPREFARLMGFPESFILPKQEGLAYRQLGNAVCPPLISALGAAILSALEGGMAPSVAATEQTGRAKLSPMLNSEALNTCLRLTLAASPAHRQPVCCHLPATVVRCWSSFNPDPNPNSTPNPKPNPSSIPDPNPKWIPPCKRASREAPAETKGAAYHAPLPNGWVCVPICEALAHTSACCHAAMRANRESNFNVNIKLNRCGSVTLMRDANAPAQTIPSPTSAHKSLAGLLMRNWSRVNMLRACSI